MAVTLSMVINLHKVTGISIITLELFIYQGLQANMQVRSLSWPFRWIRPCSRPFSNAPILGNIYFH